MLGSGSLLLIFPFLGTLCFPEKTIECTGTFHNKTVFPKCVLTPSFNLDS